INVMNRDKKNYNKLKKYWKLLLKDQTKLDYKNYTYHRCFKKHMCEVEILHYLIDLDSELKASYELYQYVQHCIKTKDFELLKKTQLYENRHQDNQQIHQLRREYAKVRL
ncbi:hypothetical protein P4473_00305, partial [Ureibacillus thermosphaericus]